nr:hypothetical protein Iba_chr12bCG12480 [Ipomoea batatas]
MVHNKPAEYVGDDGWSTKYRRESKNVVRDTKRLKGEMSSRESDSALLSRKSQFLIQEFKLVTNIQNKDEENMEESQRSHKSSLSRTNLKQGKLIRAQDGGGGMACDGGSFSKDSSGDFDYHCFRRPYFRAEALYRSRADYIYESTPTVSGTTGVHVSEQPSTGRHGQETEPTSGGRDIVGGRGSGIVTTSYGGAQQWRRCFPEVDDVSPKQQLGATVTDGNNGTWFPLYPASLIDVRVDGDGGGLGHGGRLIRTPTAAVLLPCFPAMELAEYVDGTNLSASLLRSASPRRSPLVAVVARGAPPSVFLVRPSKLQQ